MPVGVEAVESDAVVEDEMVEEDVEAVREYGV